MPMTTVMSFNSLVKETSPRELVQASLGTLCESKNLDVGAYRLSSAHPGQGWSLQPVVTAPHLNECSYRSMQFMTSLCSVRDCWCINYVVINIKPDININVPSV